SSPLCAISFNHGYHGFLSRVSAVRQRFLRPTHIRDMIILLVMLYQMLTLSCPSRLAPSTGILSDLHFGGWYWFVCLAFADRAINSTSHLASFASSGAVTGRSHGVSRFACRAARTFWYTDL